MRDVDRRLAGLAVRQHEVFSRKQARDRGLSASALSRRIATGQIVARGRQALHFPGVKLTYRGRLQAGLFDAGPDAMIGGRAAASLYRLDGFREGPLEFVTLHDRRRRTPHVLHSVDAFGPSDCWSVAGMRCTSPTLTVIHLFAWGSDDEATNALDSACRMRLTSVPDLRQRLDEMGRAGRAGVARFESTVRSAVVDSWLERRFLRLLRSAGLPIPAVQQRWKLAGVGVVRVDFEFPLWGVVIEVGGRLGYQSNPDRTHKERRRNALQLDGKTVYFFTHHDVVNDPSYAVGTVAAALGMTIPTQRTG
ncbi:type IV toxin-antitoxin system AbiEi family antitoxin domain-containing protein [Desertimonas flava]|uniref:type IV toxin-antitoxin system AbiEi family antitoxin domain-containing protein n=1 Tax=Desertimonas flava TaxID=2064846 RepID=UPI000E3513B4|nr:type IV toxin-antitoxin system AbiEi family antitoxin domain-containing protein [Desertimonas flava]